MAPVVDTCNMSQRPATDAACADLVRVFTMGAQLSQSLQTTSYPYVGLLAGTGSRTRLVLAISGPIGARQRPILLSTGHFHWWRLTYRSQRSGCINVPSTWFAVFAEPSNVTASLL